MRFFALAALGLSALSSFGQAGLNLAKVPGVEFHSCKPIFQSAGAKKQIRPYLAFVKLEKWTCMRHEEFPADESSHSVLIDSFDAIYDGGFAATDGIAFENLSFVSVRFDTDGGELTRQWRFSLESESKGTEHVELSIERCKVRVLKENEAFTCLSRFRR